MRLGVIPMAALAVTLATGQALPFLIPMFIVIMLMLSPTRLPLMMVVRMLALIVGCTALICFLAHVVGTNPVAFWLAMAAVVVLAFARLGKNPDDLPGLLVLIVSSMTMVLVQSQPSLVLALPVLMGKAFLIAYLWCLLAFAIWPRPSPPLIPLTAMRGDERVMLILGKSAALLLAIGIAIWLQDSSAILIGATIANLLRASDPHLTRMNSKPLLQANLLAAALATPVILLAYISQSPLILSLLALAGSIWLAGRLAAAWPKVVVQTAMTVYITLLGTALPCPNISKGCTWYGIDSRRCCWSSSIALWLCIS
ncbi:hypothetical protein KBAD50_20290 [Aeromonas dhakensis]|nr:hypothetical protein KBAD59_20960 [Aeromonas dhakensis]CAD7520511.1 hypothetical protein KBAD50_20290 [Aeromonas dhakensis]